MASVKADWKGRFELDLAKLFEMQKALDDHIMDEHPELKGKNNLDWKILALQVEIGECANEWRGFKKWSNDQEPRICEECHGEGNLGFRNPLLEEYVDCLHFILSIGLEYGVEWLINHEYMVGGYKKSFWNSKYTIEQFKLVFYNISNLAYMYDPEDYISLVSEFLGLGEMLGFTWDQIEQAYFEKNKINHNRKESGY